MPTDWPWAPHTAPNDIAQGASSEGSPTGGEVGNRETDPASPGRGSREREGETDRRTAKLYSTSTSRSPRRAGVQTPGSADRASAEVPR
jgi:hypothetical protein